MPTNRKLGTRIKIRGTKGMASCFNMAWIGKNTINFHYLRKIILSIHSVPAIHTSSSETGTTLVYACATPNTL